MPNNALAAQRRRCAKTLAELAGRSGWGDADVHWHAAQIDRYFNDLRRLEKRMRKPNQRRTRTLRRLTLKSYSGALCAYLQELHAGGFKKIEPVSSKQMEQLVRSANPTRRIFDHVVLSAHKKANGTRRIISSPGRKFRIAQRLVGDVLQASGVCNSYDYSRAGRGTQAAIAEIARLVEEEGIRDFVVFDLENYFTSVDAKHLKGAPLPKKVIEHSVLFNRRAVLLQGNCSAAEAETARHGLPQGARVSGILASSLLGRELRELSGAMGIVTYVDDGVIGACDPAGAKSLAEALKLRFEIHPGGPLGFKTLQVKSIGQGFEFLGYYLRSDPTSDEARVIIKPSHEAWQRLRRRLMRKLANLSPKPDWDQAINAAQKYAKRWRRSFLAWEPTKPELREFAGFVDCLVGDFFNGYTSKHVLKPPPFHCIG